MGGTILLNILFYLRKKNKSFNIKKNKIGIAKNSPLCNVHKNAISLWYKEVSGQVGLDKGNLYHLYNNSVFTYIQSRYICYLQTKHSPKRMSPWLKHKYNFWNYWSNLLASVIFIFMNLYICLTHDKNIMINITNQKIWSILF